MGRPRTAGTLGIGAGLGVLAVHGLHFLLLAAAPASVAAAFQFVCHIH